MAAQPLFHRLKVGVTWCCLVKCHDGYLLIDTSSSNRLPALQKRIANLGIDLAEIKHLLLTHHHDDHAGCAAELVRRTGCRLIVHREGIEHLERGRSGELGRAFNRRVNFALSVYFLFHGDSVFPPLKLGDNDVVLSGDDFDLLNRIGVDGRILHTPGHCDDCLSVVLSDGSAFVGDAAVNFLRWTGVGRHPVYVENLDRVYQSWRKLLDEGAKMIYPSHGAPFPAEKLAPLSR